MKLNDIVDDETYDNLDWEYVERDQFPSLMKGHSVVGMEPIVTPEFKSMGMPEYTEGIIIYLEGKEQQLFALEVTADKDRGKWDDAILVSIAKIPENNR